ncbi:MAG: flagellar hook-basal body protein [Wolinella sp.]
MQSGYYNSVGGMVTQFHRLDMISHNLANVTTNGFKRDDVVIGDFMRLYEQHKEELPLRNHTKEAARFLNRSMDRVPSIVEEYTDRSLGSITPTEDRFNFALQNDNAYFMIETPEGIRYTRNGSFTLNENGRLVTKEGFAVLPREYLDGPQYIDIPDGVVVEADKNGNLYTRTLNNEALGEMIPLGNLAIASFENPKYLKKIGANLYKYPEERLTNDRTMLENSKTVLQGYVEKSNVNAVWEMTGLIETNRLVDMYSKVMKSHMDDLNSEAINKLAMKA